MTQCLLSMVTIVGSHAEDAEKLVESMAREGVLGDRRVEWLVYDTLDSPETKDMFRRWEVRFPNARMVLKTAGDPCLFYKQISSESAQEGNRFLGELVLDHAKKYFDFALARNVAASFAASNYVFAVNSSDVVERLNVDALVPLLSVPGFAINIKHFLCTDLDFHIYSRIYDRRAWRWTGRTHEYLDSMPSAETRTTSVGTDTVKLKYFRNFGKARNYALGLWAEIEATDRKVARWFDYLGNEVHAMGYPIAATKAWLKGAEMPDGWHVEKCEALCRASVVFSDGLGSVDDARDALVRALDMDASRREPWILLSELARKKNKHHLAKGYAMAALSQRAPDFASLYENPKNYADRPHELAHWAHSWIKGEKTDARHHQKMCERYAPDYWYYRGLRNHRTTALAFLVRDDSEKSLFGALSEVLADHCGGSVACQVVRSVGEIDEEVDVVVCPPKTPIDSLPRACKKVLRYTEADEDVSTTDDHLCWLPIERYASCRSKKAIFPLAEIRTAIAPTEEQLVLINELLDLCDRLPLGDGKIARVMPCEGVASRRMWEMLALAYRGASVALVSDVFDRRNDAHLLPFLLLTPQDFCDRFDVDDPMFLAAVQKFEVPAEWFTPSVHASLFKREILDRA